MRSNRFVAFVAPLVLGSALFGACSESGPGGGDVRDGGGGFAGDAPLAGQGGTTLGGPDAGDTNTPVARDDALDLSAEAPSTVPAPGVLDNDEPNGAELVTLAVDTRLGGRVTLTPDGSFVYTPPADPGHLPRVDDFTYILSGADGEASATVALTLYGSPIAADDDYGTLEDTPLLVAAPGVLGNDDPNGATIEAFDATSTAGGVVSIEPSGALSYTPPAGFVGADSFFYTLTDVAGSATASVNVQVGREPLAADDQYLTSKSELLTPERSVLDNDALGAPDAVIVSFGGGSLGGSVTDHAVGTTAEVAGSSLTLAANGLLIFEPEPDLVGPFEFTYHIENASGSSEATVVIDVHEAPFAVDDELDMLAGATLDVAADDAESLLYDDVGTPAPVITSYGGGTLGGSVTDHLAGASVTTGGGTLTVNSDGSFTFATTPEASGEVRFDYHIENAAGNDEGSVTITVAHPPEITSPNVLTLRAGADTNLPFELTATGTPEPALSVEGELPSGVVFEDGSLTGAPAAGGGGVYALTVTAENGVEPDAVQTLTVSVQTEAVLLGAADATFTVGTEDNYTVTTIGGVPAPTLTLVGTLPLGLTFDPVTGSISGTPEEASGGTYAVEIIASNAIGVDAELDLLIEVLEAPEITSDDAVTFSVGELASFEVTTTGNPDRTVTLSGTLPPGLSFDSGTGLLEGTPSAGSGGEHELTVEASNGVLPDALQELTVTINEAPSLSGAATATFTIGSAGTYTATRGGFPVPTLSLSGALPAGVSFNAETGTISGTPEPGTSGSYALTVSAENGIGTAASLSVTLGVQEVSNITSANATTFVVGTAGTFTVTAVGTPAPTLSVSGTLPAGVSFAPVTGVLSGTPAAGMGGTYSLTIGADNGVGTAGSQRFTLTVNEAPSLLGAATATFVVGQNGSYSATRGGFPLATLSLSGSLPSGLSFDATSGSISGTPAAGTGGSYPVSVGADNGIGSAASLPVTLTVNEGPAITSASATTFTVGSAGSFAVTRTGTPTATLSVTGSLPSGVTFSAGTGVLSGTPAAGTGGTYTLTFGANNGVGSAASQSFTLTVNQAPSLSGAASATFVVGTPNTYTATRSGFPQPTLSLSGSLPSGLSFGAATGTISGTAASGTGGSYSVTIGADNGVGAIASLPVAITVNEGSAITSANATTFTAGSAGSFNVTATGSPAPTLSLSGSLPSGVTFVAATGVLSGTPAAGTGGAYPLTVGASNGVGSAASQTFTLTVNEAPSISGAATTTFVVGSAGNYTVTRGGFPAPTFSVSGSLPSGLTVSTSTGAISGTPASGTAGSYPVTLRAENGIGAAATLALTITVDQAAAITSGDATTFTAGSAGTFTVTATGTPAPTFGVTGTLPSGVTLNTSSGVLSGTPAAGTGGTYSLTLSATNGVGTAASQSFTLTVNEAASISGAATATFTVGASGSYSVTSSGFPTPTLGLNGSLPSGLTFSATTGGISGTPGAGTAGSYPVTITADNGIGSEDSVAVTITVNQGAAITSANATTFTAGSAGTFTVTATGSPAPTFGVTGTLPSGVTLNTSSGELSGTPGAGTGGTYPLTFSADNGVGTAASQSFTLTVNQAPSISGAPPSPVDSGVAYSHSFTLSGFPAPTTAVFAGTLPTGLSLSTSGVLSGTPTTAGTFSAITVRATNAASVADITFTIVVIDPTPPPSATGESFAVTGNIPIDVPVGSSVLNNDTLNTATLTGFGPSLALASTTAPGGTLTTTAGGSVTLASNGSFSYDPPAGTTGSDSFAYTITNVAGSATAQVSLTISNRVWFVNATAAVGGSGKFTSPFTDLPSVTSTTSGDVIYALRPVSTYSAKTLSSGQRLLGQGVTVSTTHLGFSLAPFSRSNLFGTAGANSTMRTLTLASNSYVRGFNVTAASGSRGLVASSASSVDVSGMGISAINAAAVELVSTSGTVSLTSVSANSGANGVILTNTTGSFTVTGDGTAAQNGSGGTIQSTTADGMLLTNAQNVTLRSMNLQSITSSALRGIGVSGLTLQGMTFSTIGTALDFDENVSGNANLTGVVSITSCSFANATSKFFALLNFSGTITSLAFENNTLNTNPSGAFEALIFDAATGGTFSVKNNTFTNAANSVSNAAIQIYLGRTVSATSTPSVFADVQNNTITGSNGTGIRLRAQDSNATLRARVLNNSVTGMTSSGFSQGIRIESGSSTGDTTVCAQISGNTSVFSMGGLDPSSTPNGGIGLRRQTGTGGTNDSFGIVGLPAGTAVCPQTGTSTCAATPAVESFVGGLNPGSPGAAANGSLGAYLVSSTTGFSSCTLP